MILIIFNLVAVQLGQGLQPELPRLVRRRTAWAGTLGCAPRNPARGPAVPGSGAGTLLFAQGLQCTAAAPRCLGSGWSASRVHPGGRAAEKPAAQAGVVGPPECLRPARIGLWL